MFVGAVSFVLVVALIVLGVLVVVTVGVVVSGGSIVVAVSLFGVFVFGSFFFVLSQVLKAWNEVVVSVDKSDFLAWDKGAVLVLPCGGVGSEKLSVGVGEVVLVVVHAVVAVDVLSSHVVVDAAVVVASAPLSVLSLVAFLGEGLFSAVLGGAGFTVLVEVGVLSAEVVLWAPVAFGISVFAIFEVFGLTESGFGLDGLGNLGVWNGAFWLDVGSEFSEEVTGGLVLADEV